MGQTVECEHEFSYLLKKHNDADYTGRVLQIPAVIVHGKNEIEVTSKVKEATLDYLKTFKKEHEKVKKELLESVLVTPANGFVVETKAFKVKC